MTSRIMVPPNQAPLVSVTVSTNTNPIVSRAFLKTQRLGVSTSQFDIWAITEPLHMIADAGSTVELIAERFPDGSADPAEFQIDVLGHLIDL